MTGNDRQKQNDLPHAEKRIDPPTKGIDAMTSHPKTIAAGIVCSCGSTSLHVIRTTSTATGILRRRECCVCGARLTTRERLIGSVPAITPGICIGQIEKSLALFFDRPFGNSADGEK